ncbi:MAG: hypothetical protein WCV56_00425 [Candidatus Omnitrophota bacterium]
MIITFSGLDGSGKTTYSRMVTDHIHRSGKKCGSFHVIKDSISHFFTHKVVGGIYGKAKDGAEAALREKDKSFRSKTIALVKKSFLVADILLFNIRYGGIKGKKDRVLVADRYFYDELVQAAYLGISGKLFERVYKKLIIDPDIAFFVELAPEKAYGRKKEYDIEYFEAKSIIYEGVCKSAGFQVLSDLSLPEAECFIKNRIDDTFKNS